MTDLEIPFVPDRGPRYRFFERLPGFITWSILILPLVLSQTAPTLCVILIIAYLLLWFVKSVGLSVRAVQGYHTMQTHMKLPWGQMLDELGDRKPRQPSKHIPTWHYANIRRLQEKAPVVEPDDIIHAVIIATWNESREVLEPTVQSVLDSDYDMKKVFFVLAYEERGGPDVEAQANKLVADFKDSFGYAMAAKHIDQPGEVIGKGGNITYAARELEKYLKKEGIDPKRVIVTTLDADNRPHKHYLTALTYLYVASPDPLRVSFQPIPMYTNNIWDAPAPMRVIATGNSFWNVVLSMRPHLIRNFSSHAQGMEALILTDYWSVRTIVEDGHQFWRSYFRFDGNYEVYPLYIPIYQDAVLSNTYRKTLRAQFVQIRRWAWGASDVAYVADKGFYTPNEVPKLDLTFKFLRLLEGHISWATAPFILAFASFIPAFFNPRDYASNQLPVLASRIQTVALLGMSITLFFSIKTLPPKPERYKRHRSIFMVAQWVLLPVTTILYNALAALNSQTRLIFGWYLGKFDLTQKAVVKENKEKVM